MKELLKALGAKDETEAIAIVAASEKFTKAIVEASGAANPTDAIGVVVAWKESSQTDAQRQAEELGRVTVALTALAKDGIGDAVELQKTYDESGFLAFSDKCTFAREESVEASGIVDGLTASGRLSPANKSTFLNLYKTSGISALKAAAGALPVQMSSKPAPEQSPDIGSGLTSNEEKIMASLPTDAAKARFKSLRALRVS